MAENRDSGEREKKEASNFYATMWCVCVHALMHRIWHEQKPSAISCAIVAMPMFHFNFALFAIFINMS